MLHQLTWEAMCHNGIPLAGDAGLLEVAVRFGYGSTEAFARAFREQ